MIFVTVGGQAPFDRLVLAVDDWAAKHKRDDVFAQTGGGEWVPRAIRYEAFLSPERFDRTAAAADLIVAHAGMGTIITALELGKPILVMPRRAAFGEHRNDHQLATVERFAGHAGVHVARDEAELPEWLDRAESLPPPGRLSDATAAELIATIREFIASA